MERIFKFFVCLETSVVEQILKFFVFRSKCCGANFLSCLCLDTIAGERIFLFFVFRYKCCGATAELQRSGCSPRYSCCLREVDRLGCRKVCKKCGRDWGSPALDCFRKDHELVDINLPPTASPTTAATSQASSPPTEEDSLLSRPPSVAGGLSGQLKPSYRHSAPHSSSSFLPNITYHII